MSDESMRERVARALEPSAFEVFDRGYTCQNALAEIAFLNAEKSVKRARKKADAALRTLREPTEVMVDRISEDPRVLSMCYLIEQRAGADTEADPHRICADIWRSMIDAALADG